MAQEDDAEQRAQIARAENLGDEAAGERHRPEPQQPDQGGEDEHARLVQRRHDEAADDQRAGQIEQREHVLLAMTPAQPAGGEGADDVAEADHAEGGRAQHRRKPCVRQERRQMGRDEIDVEAADEEAAAEEPEAAMGARLRQGLAQGLGLPFRRGMVAAHPDQARHHQRGEGDVDQQRRRPAEAAQQGAAQRREDELPERPAGGGDAQRHAAPFGRHRAPDRAQHDREAGGADAEADQHAGAHMQPERALRRRHPGQAAHIDDRPQGDDAARAVAVGEGAEDGLADPPDDALDGDGEREHLARDREIEAHRRAEEAEGDAQPVAQRQHRGAAKDEEGEPGGGAAHARRASARSTMPAARSSSASLVQNGGTKRSTLRCRPRTEKSRPWARQSR